MSSKLLHTLLNVTASLFCSLSLSLSLSIYIYTYIQKNASGFGLLARAFRAQHDLRGRQMQTFAHISLHLLAAMLENVYICLYLLAAMLEKLG